MPRELMTPRDHFGLLAPIYDRVMRPPSVDQLRSLGRLGANDRLLDAGGGTGRVAEVLRPFTRTTCVLDLSAGMLSQAVDKRSLLLCQGMTEAMPFADGAFDKIVAVDTFHHFAAQERAAAEMVRVLASGGTLVIEEPDIRRVPVKVVSFVERLVGMRSRFLRPERYVTFFTTASTRVRVYEEPPNFWVVVDKSR